MNRPHHTHELSRFGRRKPRPRWWAVVLAGVTGLALTTIGVAATPAAETVGHTLASADDRPGQPDRPAGSHQDDGKGDGQGEGKKESAASPVPCDADALIAAITLANARGGAVLDLAKDCTYLLTADIDGAGLPAITTPITLNGNKHTTIERAAATDQFRILTVGHGGDLTLNHLRIAGGQTDGSGGGILVNTGGALTTKHSTITQNIAGNVGGGIFNLGSTAIHSSAVTANAAGIDGGGINSQVQLSMTDSLVARNRTAANSGGGAALFNSATVSRSEIVANYAHNAGGGLIIGSGANVIIEKSKITANRSGDNGGGISVPGTAQLTMRHTVTSTNHAGGAGGGVFVNLNNNVTIEDSVIENNRAAGDGGGLANLSTSVLRDTRVIGNQAEEGGGIFNGNAGALTLFASKVTKNVATTDGGGILNELGGTVELNPATGTIVIQNRPNNCTGDVPGCAG
ncbi:autotransporter outer membrane beta-barrel domain-containing protein [Salinispora fenicalii]|uniref:right-handed parallel beta-helix repeat-containing protein n=1 Tax=Salinispora fenicalii TaxID=1137263 RepID=UPI000480810E|nr:right-handed parallel beta-helix repeat-containing protein [Salinispora fenicalii]